MGESISVQVREIAANLFNVPIDEVNQESSMKTIANWDSLQQLNLVLALEQNFVVEFTPEEIAQMIDIKSIVTLIEEKTSYKK